jgi:DNA (cytosine-5)-methyltransferase 1
VRAAILFSGIGGWEIACEMNGVEVAWACEWEDWKRGRYLERWPGAVLMGDVEKIDGRQMLRDHGPIDLLLGSPPCTDISAANVNGCGIAGAESRYYLEAIRLARETGARWIGFENSPRLRTRGADRVLDLLGDAGYARWPCVVEAEDAGAPHERGRSFVLGCRRDAIEGADTIGSGLWQQPGRRGGTHGAGAAESQAHADTDLNRQPDRAEHGQVGRSTRADECAGVGHREAADVHCEQRRHRTGRGDRPQVDDGSGSTPCHSASRARSEWQGVGSDALEKLTALERAALCPWDQRGDGLAGYLSMADGLATRLRGHGLSERAVKAELARWRSALGDALVIPVVWAVVRAIVRTDRHMGKQ